MGAFDHFFGLGRGEFEKKNFPKIQMPGGLPGRLPGGMLRLRFDWCIKRTKQQSLFSVWQKRSEDGVVDQGKFVL